MSERLKRKTLIGKIMKCNFNFDFDFDFEFKGVSLIGRHAKERK